MDVLKMKDIPREDRPYEKCVRLGPEKLGDDELLAVIIRTGSRECNSLETARKVLALGYPRDGILGLCHLKLPELKKVKGIGTVKGIQIQCIGELSRRISRRSAISETETFQDPAAVANYYMEDMRHMEQEQLHAMFLNVKNRLIQEVLISKGTVNASIASPREILIQALRYGAVGVILVHNHPSGDPVPSREDIALTKRVAEAGKLTDIQLLDHVIIGDHCYCSLKKEGIL